MAHLIDNSKGFNAFITKNQTAWHGLGETFTNDITASEALKKAGLDFTVLKMPNVHVIPDLNDINNSIEIVSKDSFFTYRTDCNKILGSKLGAKYTVMQNQDALDIVDAILQYGGTSIETAGSIDNGKKVFICLKIDKAINVNGTDAIYPYLLICNSHDGSMAITAKLTGVRVVCNNTLSMALGKGAGSKLFTLMHTSGAQNKMQEALKLLNLVKDTNEQTEVIYNSLANKIIDEKIMFDYFGSLVLDASEIAELRRGENIRKVASTNKINNLGLLAKSANGIGQKETLINGNPTAWTAYNAYTSYLSSGKGYNTTDDRANSMLFGTNNTKNDKALALAIDIDNIQPLRKDVTNFNFN